MDPVNNPEARPNQPMFQFPDVDLNGMVYNPILQRWEGEEDVDLAEFDI